MDGELVKYLSFKEAELKFHINNSYPAKNKFSSKEAHHSRHSGSVFASRLRANVKDFGTNYKIED